MKRIFSVVVVSGALLGVAPAIALAAANSPAPGTLRAISCGSFQKMKASDQGHVLESIRVSSSTKGDSMTNDKQGVPSDYGLMSEASMKELMNACRANPDRDVITAMRKYFNS